MSIKSILIFFIVCIPILSNAQKTEPEWTVEIGNIVNNPVWMKQFATGILIVGAEAGIYGIDPVQKKVIWEKPKININADQCNDINGSPYAMITYTPLTSLSEQYLIFNTVDGKEAFDSKSEKIRVDSYYPLHSIGGMLIEMTKDKRSSMIFIDFSTSECKWTIDMGEGKGRLGAAIKSVKAAMANKYPFVDSEKNIIMVNGKILTRINAKTGDVIWKKEFDKNTGELFEDEKQKKIYFGQVLKSVFIGVNLSDGTEVWPKPLKLKGEFNKLFPYSEEEVIIQHSNGFNILNLASGEFKFAKDPKVGNVNDIRIVDNGFVTADIQEKATKISFVDMSGAVKWHASVDGVFISYSITPKGVFYLTKNSSNILSMDKGKGVWKKNLKIKGTPRYFVDEKNDRIALYTDGKLYTFELNSGDFKLLQEKIKLTQFVDKDQEAKFSVGGFDSNFFNDGNDMVEIENVNDKYLIRTNQNFCLIDMDGQSVYNKFYPAAGMSRGASNLMKAASIAGVYGGVAVGFSGIQKELLTGDGKTQMHTANAMIYASGGMYELSTRIAATSQTKNNVYVLTKFDDGTKGLVSMDKSTGNETDRIIFNDKTPVYSIDDVYGKLYLLTSKGLNCYNLEIK